MSKTSSKFNVTKFLKNKFQKIHRTNSKFLKTVPGSESMVLCTLCDSILSVADGGRTRINDHTNTKKHIKSLEVVNSNQSISTLLAVDPLTMQLQGEELAFAMNPDAAFNETLLLNQFLFENLPR
jgi:ribosomal protein S27E